MGAGVTGTPGVENYVNSINTSASGSFGTGGTALVSATTGFDNATPGGFLEAALGGVESQGGDSGNHALTYNDLAPIVSTAIARWVDAGLTAAQLLSLDHLGFAIANLSGSDLGEHSPDVIIIDEDGGGRGWFIDATPADDAEFGHALSATQLQTDPSGVPAGNIDLLTVVMHEIGHALGLDHTADASDLMSDHLVAGERRLPGAMDVAAEIQRL